MKINIVGKGIIPGMGILPPVYNIEKSETDVRRLTNFRNIRVYCSENGLLITKKNVDSFFKVKPHVTVNVDDVKPKVMNGTKHDGIVEQNQQQKDTSTVIDNDIDITKSSEEFVDEPEFVMEELIEEDIESITPVEEPTIDGYKEETESGVVESTNRQSYSSKKKNRNRK